MLGVFFKPNTEDMRDAPLMHIVRALEGTDGVANVTEWNEFCAFDLKRLKSLLKRPVIGTCAGSTIHATWPDRGRVQLDRTSGDSSRRER